MSKMVQLSKKRKNTKLYMKNVLTRKVSLPFQDIGSNIEQLIHENLEIEDLLWSELQKLISS